MERTCDDQQAAYLDGDPDAAEHLGDCPACMLERAALDDIRSVLTEEATWIEPPADLEDRVVAAALGDELSARRARRTQSRSRRRSGWLVAAAACVLGVLIGGTGVFALSRPPGSPQSVALAATTRFPQASATVHIRSTSNGLEIHLDVTGLPTAPAGSFYEAWMKGPGGLVPIGTFHTGNGQITLWSGVALDTHPTFTVTIQTDNGDPTSSGKQVLVGTLK